MQEQKIYGRREGAVGHLVFNNPAKLNAVSLDMWDAFVGILKDYERDPEVRCVVVSGAGGKAFVSGADISKFESERANAEAEVRYDAISREGYEGLYDFAKPTIAKIAGYCIGGGMNLAACCDMRFCNEGARFGVPAARLGLGYGFTRIERLSHIVGLPRAMEFLFTAKQYSAKEAYDMGLVNGVAADAEIDALVAKTTDAIAVNAPLTIALAKAAARELADWGAQVIKIEQPAEPGSTDAMGGARHGFDFQNLHRNKQAMTLNLKSKEGHAIFMKLAKKADVIVENYRSDVKYRLKVDYKSVKKVNPKIIYGSIAGFGQSGPDAARPGVDQIAQGMGGLMSITGEPGRGPMRVGIPIADLTSGLLLAQAIILALYHRKLTGKGQWVHTSLIEAQIFMLDFQASRWLMKGEVAKQAGNDHPTGIPTGVFPTSDGYINIAASGDNLFKRCATAMGAEDLPNHPDYKTPPARSKNRHALNAALAEVTKTKPNAHWGELLYK